MQAHCLSRLSAGRAGLATAHVLLYNTHAAAQRVRLVPDIWRQLQHLLPHDHPATVSSQPSVANRSGLPDGSWCHKLTDMQEEAGHGQLRDGFHTLATSPYLGMAEVAAALALVSISPVTAPNFMVPIYPSFPMAIKYSQLSTPPLVLDDGVFTKTLAASATGATGASNIATKPTDGAATSVRDATPKATASVDSSTAAAAASSFASAASTLLPDLTAAAYLPPASADAADYLPEQLRAFVPASLDDYWKGVRGAMLEGRLHATIYVSSTAWDHLGPTIVGMIGTAGTGPTGQVRFAVVPLGGDYALRAEAAYMAMSEHKACEEVARGFGLDVALASCAMMGSWSHRIEVCPAMVVRGGYTGSSQCGELYPAWSMRQELDKHVRRNLFHVQQLSLGKEVTGASPACRGGREAGDYSSRSAEISAVSAPEAKQVQLTAMRG